MTELIRQNGLRRLEVARSATVRQIEDVPEEKWCHQAPGQANHFLWTVGHLAVTDDFFLRSCSSTDRPNGCPAGWRELFGTGSKPTPNLDDYPPLEEVRRFFDERRSALRRWFEGLSQETLCSELPQQELRRFAANYADLMPSLSWHEGWHAGQLSPIRKDLGLPSYFT